MHTAILGIGGNIGDRHKNLELGRKWISTEVGTITSASAIYQTAAWGMDDAPDFYNQVLVIATRQSPQEIMEHCHHIEAKLGRERIPGQYLSRKLDIDLLAFDDEMIDSEELQVPHPKMHERLFVLAPLAEVAPKWRHPKLDKTAVELLNDCDDKSAIKRLDEA